MKKYLVIFLVIILLLSFVGCKLSSKDLIGKWNCSWVYNGYRFDVTLEFFSDGTCSEVMYRDLSFYDLDNGVFTIDGNIVTFDGDGLIEYEYSHGRLINNNHEFIKEK